MSTEQKDRPAYLRFERKPIEDRAASEAAGRYIAKDVDYAIVTPVGTKDEIPKLMSDWLPDLAQKVKEGRIPPEHEEFYRRSYEAWKRGEEVPPTGTPIREWSVVSPAQRANIISANIRTVEDLAGANGEALTRIGMGAIALKQKAEAWLKACVSVGVVVQENTALKIKVAHLEGVVKGLETRNEALAKQVAASVKPETATA